MPLSHSNFSPRRRSSLKLFVTLAAMAPFAANAQFTITTLAGGGPPEGIPATQAAIGATGGLAVDSAGNIYVPSAEATRVFKVNPSGSITTFAGNGGPGFAGDGGQATAAQLNNPRAVTFSSGSLYIADSNNYRIRKVTNGVITTVAGNGSLGSAGDGGPATAAELGYSSGVAVDAAGNIYISDSSVCRIRKVNTSGVIDTIAGTGTCGYSGDNGSAF